MTRRGDEDQARRLWRLSAMGSELAFGIIGMVLVGVGIDYFFGTGPKGVIICTIVGVLAAGYNFIRQAMALIRAPASRPGRATGAPTPSEKTEEADGGLEFPPDFDEF